MSYYDRTAPKSPDVLGPSWLQRRPDAYEPSRLAARLAILGIGIAAALSLVLAATVAMRELNAPTFERPSDIAAELTFHNAAGVPFLVAVLVLGGPAFLWWQTILVRNVNRVSGGSGPQMLAVVLDWVLPVGNVFRPGMRMLDAANGLGGSHRLRATVIGWWVAWLAVLGLLALKSQNSSVLVDLVMRLMIAACGSLAIAMIVVLDGTAERTAEERGMGHAEDGMLLQPWMAIAAIPVTALIVVTGNLIGQPGNLNDYYRQKFDGEAYAPYRLSGEPVPYTDVDGGFQMSYPAWWQPFEPPDQEGLLFAASDLRGSGRDAILGVRRDPVPKELKSTALLNSVSGRTPAGSRVGGNQPSPLRKCGAIHHSRFRRACRDGLRFRFLG